MRPHRNSRHRVRRLSPFHLLDHFGVGLLDEHSDPSEHLAPPIPQLLDSRIDQPRGRVSSFSFLDAALRLFHGWCRFLHGRFCRVRHWPKADVAQDAVRWPRSWWAKYFPYSPRLSNVLSENAVDCKFIARLFIRDPRWLHSFSSPKAYGQSSAMMP